MFQIGINSESSDPPLSTTTVPHHNNNPFPTEIWAIIISYLPSPFTKFHTFDPLSHQLTVDSSTSPRAPTVWWTPPTTFEQMIDHDNSSSAAVDEIREEQSYDGLRKRIKEWNQFRSNCSFIYGACKLSILEMDLSCWFESDLEQIDSAKREIIGPGKKHLNYPENFQKRLFPKRKELLKFNQNVMSEIMMRQERACDSFVKGFVNGFMNVKKLNLDGWYFMKENELDEICKNLKHLEDLSIVKCKRVKKLERSSIPNLKNIRMHVNQIKLRINMSKFESLHVEVVEGIYLHFKTFESSFSEQFYYYYFIEEVKEVLERKVGVSKNDMRLIFAGKQLMDDRRLVDYCVSKESTVHLLLKMK